MRYISCRVTVCGETAEVSTGIRIDPQHWDNECKRLHPDSFENKAKKTKALQLNRKLDTLQETLEHLERDLRIKKETVSASSLKALYKGDAPRDSYQTGFLQVFDRMIGQKRRAANR